MSAARKSNQHQIAGTKMQGHQIINWQNWSEQLWKEAESGWLNRDGQDHFYRQAVVLPAVNQAVTSLPKRPNSIIDLGCGDGHSTSLLVAELKRRRWRPSIILADRSQYLLNATRRDIELIEAQLVQTDFTNTSWWQEFPEIRHPAILFAHFLLQELPDLTCFFKGIKELMLEDSCLFAVVPAPRYVESLRRSSRARVIMMGADDDDWKWVGEYPISIPCGSLALPHFQRTIGDYRCAAKNNNISMIEHYDLYVPDTKSARNVFSDTVYGHGIIGQPSSKLLVFTKKDDSL